MRLIKRVLACALAATMVFSIAACGEPEQIIAPNGDASQGVNVVGNGDADKGNNVVGNGDSALKQVRIGTWWVQYYASGDKLTDSPDYNTAVAVDPSDTADKLAEKAFNKGIAEQKFANVAKIENKYGLKFWWENLTYTGVKESINTSILAGTPDCEVYLCDAGMAIPAQMSNLLVDLKTILPADHDLFTTQTVASYLDMGDNRASILKRNTGGESTVSDTYPLGFNMQMIEDAGLEDPRDLWDKGEWTWDKFIEYCKILTNESENQYGFCGYSYDTLGELLMSNGATICTGSKQTLDSKPVTEALEMFSDMYTYYKVCYPYDQDTANDSTSMRNQYTQGNIAFFPIACWITSGNGDYDYGSGADGVVLPFDIAYVRWPVGPSGNKDTNPGKNDVGGELYVIPQGTADPKTVFNVMYDMWNWYDGDTTLINNKEVLNWWYGSTARADRVDLQEANFNVMYDCGSHTTFDLWKSVNIYMPLLDLINGVQTPSQIQETYKQEYQDALDQYFGN